MTEHNTGGVGVERTVRPRLDMKTMDRLAITLRDNRKKCAEKDGGKVWFTRAERLREFDQMIELVDQFREMLDKA